MADLTAKELLDLLRERVASEEHDGADAGEITRGAAQGAAASLAAFGPLAYLARRDPAYGRPLPSRVPGSRDIPRDPNPGNLPKTPLLRPWRGGGGRRAMLRAGVEDIVGAVARNPRAALAVETAGGAAAGAAMTAAEEEGAGPVTTALVGTGAGITAGGLPAGGYNILRRASRWGMDNLVPFTEAGARSRAADRLQRLVGDRADAENAARAALAAPPGVTPARATGDERLMSLERRVLDDDPALDNSVARDLENAAQTAQRELAGVYGTPRGKQDWERAVFERVAAPGTEIPAGTTDEMLDAAYDSFEGMYAPVRGLPMRLQLMHTTRSTPLQTLLQNATQTRTVMAGDDARSQVASWLKSQYGGLARRARNGLVDSGDLLELRSAIRAQARGMRRSRDPLGQQKADLLELAGGRVTEVLASQLSRPAMRSLDAADQLYGDYKIVEGAVFGAGDNPFSPNHLLSSLRKAATGAGAGAYARGAEQGMRQLAQSGRRVAEVLGKPERAAAMVRGMDDEGRRSVRADFVQTLTDKATKDVEGGGTFLSGQALLQSLRHNTPTARALGMSNEELGRLDRIASELAMVQRKSPAALTDLFNDGPANLLQLVAVIVGGKQARTVGAAADVGPGSLALASYFNNKARNLMTRLTTDQAKALLIQAHTDPVLYAALLTKTVDPRRAQETALRTIGQYVQPAVQVEAWERAFEDAPPEAPTAREMLEDLRRQAEGLR